MLGDGAVSGPSAPAPTPSRAPLFSSRQKERLSEAAAAPADQGPELGALQLRQEGWALLLLGGCGDPDLRTWAQQQLLSDPGILGCPPLANSSSCAGLGLRLCRAPAFATRPSNPARPCPASPARNSWRAPVFLQRALTVTSGKSDSGSSSLSLQPGSRG